MFRTVVSGLMTTVACSAFFGAVQNARADALVIATKAQGIRSGAILPDDRVLELSAGETVTVLMVDGRSRTIAGPFKQPVASFSKGRPADDALWKSVVASLQKSAAKNRIGVARAREPVGGSGAPAARSYAKAPSSDAGSGPASVIDRPSAGVPFSWLHVPIDAEGDYCIQKGSGLVLSRGASAAVQPATVIDVRAGARAQVIFAAGNKTTPWPSMIRVTTGPYALQMPESQPRQIRLRVIDPLPQADETLRLLHSQRCQSQIDAWLRGVATAGR